MPKSAAFSHEFDEQANQKISKANELFFVVDEHDQPLEPLPRRLVHGHGVWHRVSHVWIRNNKGQLLCQQRSIKKELNPGYWEPFFGGHIRPGESYEEAALRELREELGITIASENLKRWRIYQFHDNTGYNNEFIGIFIVTWNGDMQDVRFDDGEVEQVVWKTIPEIKSSIINEGKKSWTVVGYELDLLHELEQMIHG
jgi:isopentenyldiphosphate isomerase